jgi:hypothetical protein
MSQASSGRGEPGKPDDGKQPLLRKLAKDIVGDLAAQGESAVYELCMEAVQTLLAGEIRSLRCWHFQGVSCFLAASIVTNQGKAAHAKKQHHY